MPQPHSGGRHSTKQLVLSPNEDKAVFKNGSIFFVGNATVIIHYAGFTILTDPNFLHQGEHVHLGYGIRSARRTNPAIELEDLPPVDFVMLSHMHEDHFDRVVEQKLDKELPIVTTHHAVDKLQNKGFQAAQALDPWESLLVIKGEAQVRVTAMPGRHGPAVLSTMLPPVIGSMMEFETPTGTVSFRLYISGDTLVHQPIHDIPKQYPDIDLALIHLGGTKVLGILLTMDGEQGAKMLQIIAPRTAIPIHYNDYTVMKSPLEDFMKAIAAAGLEGKVEYLSHGDTYRFEVPTERLE